jgi:prohibitin 2
LSIAPTKRPAGPAKRRPAFDFWSASLFGVLVVLFLIALLWPRIVVIVPPGSVGVLWLRFFGGTVSNFYFREGAKLVLPWDRVYLFDARLQRLDYSATTPSADGMPVTAETTVTFGIIPQSVALLQARVGPDYVERLITPLAGSALRERIAQNTAEQLYTTQSQTIEADIEKLMQRRISSILGPDLADRPLVRVAQISLRSLLLPPIVSAAIEEKVASRQGIQRYGYILDQSRLEAQRREVEAEGIRRFQEIVTPAISESFLRWRGIEATLALAQSSNAKVVVIGAGSGGLPLILDGRSDPAGNAPSPGTGAATAVPPAAPAFADAAHDKAWPEGVPKPDAITKRPPMIDFTGMSSMFPAPFPPPPSRATR